jgi:O-antigen/teichoic acid export membrane protein
MAVLAVLLPPRDFGTVATGVVIVSFATLVMDSGTRGCIIVSRDLTPEDVRRSLKRNVAVGAVFSVALAALADPIVNTVARGGDAAVLRVLGLNVLFYSLGIVPLAVLEKNLYYKRFAGVLAGSALVASVVGIGAGLLGAGVWALVIRQLLVAGLMTALAWPSARKLMPRRGPGSAPGGARPRGATWFVVFALTNFIAFNADFLIVGHLAGVTRVGLYALAFSLAFAPLTRFSSQVGKVLFPAAAATSELDAVGRRTLYAFRLTATLLLPLVPVAIVVAPWALPGVLGVRWANMVVPFQLLLLAGVSHALLNVLGESLSGTGNIGFRARASMAWLVGMVGTLFLLVSLDGIRGAAIAHIVMFVPLGGAYAVWGARRIGLTAGQLGASLRGVVWPVAAQAAATAGLLLGLEEVGFDTPAAAVVGAGAGLALVAGLLWRSPTSPLREGVGVFRMVLRASGA